MAWCIALCCAVTCPVKGIMHKEQVRTHCVVVQCGVLDWAEKTVYAFEL